MSKKNTKIRLAQVKSESIDNKRIANGHQSGAANAVQMYKLVPFVGMQSDNDADDDEEEEEEEDDEFVSASEPCTPRHFVSGLTAPTSTSVSIPPAVYCIERDREHRTSGNIMRVDANLNANSARCNEGATDADEADGHPDTEVSWQERNGTRPLAEEANVDFGRMKLEQSKERRKSIGVQTTHLSPYRLRFWPTTASIQCNDTSFMAMAKYCLRTLSQLFLSQVGLTVVLLIWALLGATAFYQTEGPKEYEQSEEMRRHKNDVGIDLATDLRQLEERSEKWQATIQKYLNKYETLLLRALSCGYVEGGGSIWTYPGCVLFAVLLLTTLGFGAPVPRTPLGRGMAVLFSAVGIPLHFLLILNVSKMIAKKLQSAATLRRNETKSKLRLWYKSFPPVVILCYYTLGVVCFGVLRQRSALECLMFALDFTESGGVATTPGHVRIFYAIYIEIAVILAATIMSIIQVSATNCIVDLGLRLGLLTNT